MSLAAVAGRLVYLRTHDHQTIRICTEANARGEWAHELWLDPGRQIAPAEISARADVADLVDWLLSIGARHRP